MAQNEPPRLSRRPGSVVSNFIWSDMTDARIGTESEHLRLCHRGACLGRRARASEVRAQTPPFSGRSGRLDASRRNDRASSNAGATWKAVESAASRQEARAPGRGTRVSSPTIRASTRRGRAGARFPGRSRGVRAGARAGRPQREPTGSRRECQLHAEVSGGGHRRAGGRPFCLQRAFSATGPESRSSVGGLPRGRGVRRSVSRSVRRRGDQGEPQGQI